jgi:hypothetical protein
MPSVRVAAIALAVLAVGLAAACGAGPVVHAPPPPDPHTDPSTGPAAGNPDAPCTVPTGGDLEDVSSVTTVVGNGTAASCSGDAFVKAVEQAPGVVTFDCGPDPVIVTLPRTARVFNRVGGHDVQRVVIDGGGKVTLSGAGAHRILYLNTCDETLTWTTSHCDDQQWPQLTVQNLTFVDGNATGSGEGGGAIFARGGRLKVVNARFFHNWCDLTGPDVGGGALRVFDQYQDDPVYVVSSTFGGSARLANYGSNGAGLSSIGVSWSVVNSVFTDGSAVGWGANPARPNTPGGGSGGAIYLDGNTISLALCGVRMTGNTAREGGGAVFLVSNDGTGHLSIASSFLSGNPSAGFETHGYPGIFVQGAGTPVVTGSTIE